MHDLPNLQDLAYEGRTSSESTPECGMNEPGSAPGAFALPSETAFHRSMESALLEPGEGIGDGKARVGRPSEAARASDVVAILAERGSRYGKFTDHAEVTQSLKAIFRARMGEKWDHLADDQKEALEMIAHKLGRIINGDPNYADSWVDIAGYSKLVADRLDGVAR